MTVDSPTEKLDEASEFQTRLYTGRDNSEYAFKFLVIDDPSKWVAAEKITGHYDMPILGQSRSLRFSLTGLSAKQWQEIETQHLIPTWDNPGKQPDDAFLDSRELALAAKRAHVIEVSSGKKIPGESYNDKAIALQKLNGGEVQALYLYIQDVVCSTEDGSLIQKYKKIASEASTDNVSEFSDFSDWVKATETGYIFRLQRPSQEFILEFPLKNISSKDKLDIELQTRDPEPPQIPFRDPNTGKMVPHQMMPDYNDRSWLERCRVVAQKRTTMLLSACLPFEIPGKNTLEQYEWISQRLIGDVIRLQTFINDELCGYRSRYDFFSVV